jgi:fatty acid desaturase
MAVSGSLWVTQKGVNGWIALPALVVYGASLATMFAALHECVHRTAFASPKLNDGVAWVAGLLSFYNSTFYRRYHKWHHRYTQIPGKDPELEDPKPQSWPEYLLELSGLTWWIGKVKTYIRIASGQLQGYPYIPESARQEVIIDHQFSGWRPTPYPYVWCREECYNNTMDTRNSYLGHW